MTSTTQSNDGDSSHESTVQHADIPSQLYRSLLALYDLQTIEGATRWLELGGYVEYHGHGIIAPKQVIALTDRGRLLASSGQLTDDERKLVYRVEPFAAFVARQFRDEDLVLFKFLRDDVLARIGIAALDGNVDGVESFRGEIIRKIRDSRFFICILTHREQLAKGEYASGVWLYQEIGAAVALGKQPLVLVERGIHEHYAGELQKNYEYIPFDRQDYSTAFQEVARRLNADLVANHIGIRAEAT